MAQTAVEWLVRQLNNEFISEVFLHRWSEVSGIIDKAKQMEKEQIVDAHYQGYRNNIGTTEVSEQYYNETYGK